MDRVGQGLWVTATAADGVVEAVEGSAEQFVLGVQWHPEMSYRHYPEQHLPFELLVEAANRHALELAHGSRP